jgi:hypothetical protein
VPFRVICGSFDPTVARICGNRQHITTRSFFFTTKEYERVLLCLCLFAACFIAFADFILAGSGNPSLLHRNIKKTPTNGVVTEKLQTVIDENTTENHQWGVVDCDWIVAYAIGIVA